MMERPLDSQQASTTYWTDDFNVEDEEKNNLLEKCENCQRRRHESQHRISRSWIWLTALNLVILCLTLLALFFNRRHTSDSEAIKRITGYTPVFKSFTPSLTPTLFNGSLFNYPPLPMRADPSPALDDEYTRLSNGGDILITRADVLGLGRDPSTRARASPSLLSAMNLPPSSELYFAQLDGFHQIHCLDMLRRHIYWDVYYAPKYGRYDSHTPHELHWTHVSHCLNVLFENLKCNADANIITSVWMEGQGYPYPDFDVVKKCGDFEGLLDWSLERSVPESLVEMMRMPVLGEEGWERVVKAPEELYRAKGVEFPEEYVVDHEVGEREFWYSSW